MTYSIDRFSDNHSLIAAIENSAKGPDTATGILAGYILFAKERQNKLVEKLIDHRDRIEQVQPELENYHVALQTLRVERQALIENWEEEKGARKAILEHKERQVFLQYQSAKDPASKEHYKTLYESFRTERESLSNL